jgi:hypothetical protein
MFEELFEGPIARARQRESPLPEHEGVDPMENRTRRGFPQAPHPYILLRKEERRTEEITFVTPGSIAAEAGFRLLLSDNAPSTLLDHYTLGAEGALVKKSDGKTLYDGPETYAVISFDGRENDDYKGFTPAAASAALLDKFYNINDGSSRPIALLQQALSLYSDMIFRDKATAAATKLGKITHKDSKEYRDLQALVEAYIANISEDVLKPTVG